MLVYLFSYSTQTLKCQLIKNCSSFDWFSPDYEPICTPVDIVSGITSEWEIWSQKRSTGFPSSTSASLTPSTLLVWSQSSTLRQRSPGLGSAGSEPAQRWHTSRFLSQTPPSRLNTSCPSLWVFHMMMTLGIYYMIYILVENLKNIC